MDPQSEKLEALSERIRQAEKGLSDGSDVKSAPAKMDSRPAMDFVGTIIGSGVVGGLIDYQFRTGPWFLLGFGLFGCVVGLFNLWRSGRDAGN